MEPAPDDVASTADNYEGQDNCEDPILIRRFLWQRITSDFATQIVLESD